MNKITYEKVNLELDYPILDSFYKKSKMGVTPNIVTLPKDGVAVHVDGKLVGAIFIWFTLGCPMFILGFPILDSDIKDTELRSSLIDGMIDRAEFLAKYNGWTIANTWSGLPHVQKRLQRIGYEVGDEGVNHYIKVL